MEIRKSSKITAFVLMVVMVFSLVPIGLGQSDVYAAQAGDLRMGIEEITKLNNKIPMTNGANNIPVAGIISIVFQKYGSGPSASFLDLEIKDDFTGANIKIINCNDENDVTTFTASDFTEVTSKSADGQSEPGVNYLVGVKFSYDDLESNTSYYIESSGFFPKGSAYPMDAMSGPAFKTVAAPTVEDISNVSCYAGDKLDLVSPQAISNGAVITSEKWQIKTVDSEEWVDFDTTTEEMDASYNNALLRYVVVNANGTGYSNEATISVYDHVGSVSLTEKVKTLNSGSTYDLKYTLNPITSKAETLTWASDNPGVASVKNGKVTAHKKGIANITINADGKTDQCKVTVVQNVTKIATPRTTYYMTKGKSYTPKVTCSDGTKTVIAKMTWSSNNKKVATVNQSTGKITAKKTGKATIIGLTESGKKITIKAIVVKKSKSAKTIKVTGLKSKYKKGKVAYAKVTVSPKNATNIKATFKSSNKKVATVTKAGKVTFKKKGKVTITIKAGGKTVKKTVKVTK